MRLIFTISFLVFLGCGGKETPVAPTTEGNKDMFTFQGLPKKVELNKKAKALVADWDAYQQFESSFAVLFNSVSNEDLEFAINDLLESHKKLERSSFPPDYDHMKVKSRLKLSKTFMLKVKAAIENRKDASSAIREMIVANNAIYNQLNLMVSDPINLDSIFNETN